MVKGFDDSKYLLVASCETTNCFIAIPIKERTSEVIAEALVYIMICIFGTSKLLIVEKASSFGGEMIQFILRDIKCQSKIISLFNHESFRTERQIKTTGKMIK